ncbi:unnamed protein product [Zymoseptoria tritici ST99CH_3D7]|uniref:SANT domain-containing protein n=1 Tax=Zymoseptoria tritici (strain ST99CH_3D7) TaxID=1276538 RepID=A0A1X7S1Q7_ZYMT9|nr:unnamed protein product [Zymoseptoria tritici ST99CH_3D7]
MSRDGRRDPPPETPAYLNGRAETTANRYGSRASSPSIHLPPSVPAFSFSVAPTAANSQPQQPPKPTPEAKPAPPVAEQPAAQEQKPIGDDRPIQSTATSSAPAPPANAPTAPKAAPAAPKAFHASPPPTAPKAPRALEMDAVVPPANRLHGVRSLETIGNQNAMNRGEGQQSASVTVPPSPNVTRQSLPHLTQSISPNPAPSSRFGDIAAPTGPKAMRNPSAQSAMSPRQPMMPARSETGGFAGVQDQSAPQRAATPPPSAPSGPRKQSFSVSPKLTTAAIPTAPKAARAPAMMSRPNERNMQAQQRMTERIAPTAPFGGPRNPQWGQFQGNQFPGNRSYEWRRPGLPAHTDKAGPVIPSKRDANGEERQQQRPTSQSSFNDGRGSFGEMQKRVESQEQKPSHAPPAGMTSRSRIDDKMSIDDDQSQRKSITDGPSARQNFFGKAPEEQAELIDTSSEDDELDEADAEEDATLLEAKHARKERELKSQMVDLSAREYRATTPLESIARLARLSTKDLQRQNEFREDDMDIDEGQTEPVRTTVRPTAQSSESDDGPEISTPHGGDEVTDVAIKEQSDVKDVRRLRRRSPVVVRLPYLIKKEDRQPFETTDIFQDNVKSLADAMPEVMGAIEDELQEEEEIEEDKLGTFEEHYRLWREECEELDRVKEEQDKLERQQSMEPVPELDTTMGPVVTPLAEGRMEGRRLHKFSSEYEIEQVLKQSEETARIEQEKLDREAKKVQADMEKEARLPDQLTEELVARTALLNSNRLRDPESLTLVFSYEPPTDDFTEAEQQIFIAAFKDTPKKWGEIASLLPNRTYKDCIAHYYANKWDGRFRDNRAKRFKGRRGGGRGGKGRPSRGSALMADLNRTEDVVASNENGRPKRAAAPTTFGEKEVEAKAALGGPSPAKKLGPGSRQDNDATGEKPAKKQRRAAGEGKPGRKAKTQQLAALAAAPTAIPNEERPVAPSLEEASLLTGFHTSHQAMHPPPEAQAVYTHDGYCMQPGVGDDLERGRPTGPIPKQSASSYWSVPEQTDFFKYIAHFGTDFAAIANHMGTKTQTMIKNHYSRQIEGGRSDLEDAANNANVRRERGEDLGPPPTPTPIVKRKYDNPQQASTPRAIAPQKDAMDMDEPMSLSQAPMPKHNSPPQFPPKPRYVSSAQGTPVPAPRAIPGPMPPASNPVIPPMQNPAHPRGGLGHPLGSRLGFLSDARAEPRPSMQPTSAFRMAQETSSVPPRSQPPPAQPARTLSNAPDHHYMQELHREQEKALRMQAQYDDVRDVRMEDRMPRQGVPHTHGSPAKQQIPAPAGDRKSMLEERGPTPPRNAFLGQGMGRMPAFSPSGMLPMGNAPLSSFGGRPHYQPSPKLEYSRPPSAMTSAPPQHPSNPAPSTVSTPAPEPPKRSNLLSILNSEPEETKPMKRESLVSAPTRVASPAPGPYPPRSSTPQGLSNLVPSRRETFGQPTMPQGHFHRGSFGQQGSTTPAPGLKHEHSSGNATPMQQPPQPHKQDWQSRVLGGQGSQSSPPNAPLDRDGRAPYFPHHRSSMMSSMNSRGNPSPPPHAMGHSRTSSMNSQQPAGSRDQRGAMGGPPPSSHLHNNPYGASHQPPPFSQAPPAQNRAVHSHNSSITGDPNMMPRFPSGPANDHSREEAIRRDREEADYRMRFDAISAERQRNEQFNAHRQQEQRHHDQRHQEQEMERQRQQQQMQQVQQQGAYPRGGAQPMQPPQFNSPFSQHRPGPPPQQQHQPMGVREQAMRDTEAVMQHEERRRQQEQQAQGEQFRRRQQEEQQQQQQGLYRRGTPGYGYGQPPPPPPPPSNRR